MTALRPPADPPFRTLVGVGGIGGGIFLSLEGDATLGREESRGARLLDVHDACKLHIVAHHVAVLMDASPSGAPFHVVPVGFVGDDDTGRWALAEMRAAGIDTTHVGTLPDRPTLFSVCFQYPDGAGGNLTTLDSAAAALTDAAVDRLEPLLAADGAHTIVLAAPEVDLAPRRRLLELATRHGAFRVASFVSGEAERARDEGLVALTDLLALNADEAGSLAGVALDPAHPAPFLDAVAAATGADRRPLRLVVTAGASGAFAFDDGRWHHRPSIPADVVSTAGAGDALLGGVLAGLAAGVPLTSAVDAAAQLTCALDLGVLLASVSVTSPDTIHPRADLSVLIGHADRAGLAFGPPLADVL